MDMFQLSVVIKNILISFFTNSIIEFKIRILNILFFDNMFSTEKAGIFKFA